MAFTTPGPIPWFVAKFKQVTAENDTVAQIVTAGGTTIPVGTLQETLQAIADLADPAV